MSTGFKFKDVQLVVGLMFHLFPLISNAANLIPDVDYHHGNGKGASFTEGNVAYYWHTGAALDHFTKRRVIAIQQHYSDLGGDKVNLPTDLEKMLKANYDVLPMNPVYSSGSGEPRKFFTRSGLERCQVFLINGKFYHYDSANLVLYNSGNAVLDGITGDIIVMDRQGNIFIYPKEMGEIHHSSFFSQKPVAFGAMVRIKDGELIGSDFRKDKLGNVTLIPKRVSGYDWPDGLFYYSGHYDPWQGSGQDQERIKQEALENFKKELTTVHFVEDGRCYRIINPFYGNLLACKGLDYIILDNIKYINDNLGFDCSRWKFMKIEDEKYVIYNIEKKFFLYGRWNQITDPVLGISSALHGDSRGHWKLEKQGNNYWMIKDTHNDLYLCNSNEDGKFGTNKPTLEKYSNSDRLYWNIEPY
jgi:hypothetical protein